MTTTGDKFLKVFDFECPTCGNLEERTTDGSDEICLEMIDAVVVDDSSDVGGGRRCCNTIMIKLIGTRSAPKTIVKGNSDFNERERERLTARSNEHWKREGRHEAIERERIQIAKTMKGI